MHRCVSLVLAPCFLLSLGAFAQTAAPATSADGATRPGAQAPLFYRMDWQPVKGVPVEHPLDQKAVAAPNLEIKLYGPSGKDIQENGVTDVTSNPMHLWTGLCAQTCAATIRERNNYVDMTGMAKIRWVTKVSGLHQVHPILKGRSSTIIRATSRCRKPAGSSWTSTRWSHGADGSTR